MLSFMKLKRHTKFEEKLTCGLENDMRNLANFHRTLGSVKIWALMGSLKNYRGVICNDTEK